MALVDVQGHCPMGCGRTLHIATESGIIACLNRHCPRPTAVSDLLATDRTDHKVEVSIGGFAIKHPLFERIEDKLFECDLQRWLEALDGPPVSAGTYRVTTAPESGPPPDYAVIIEGWLFAQIEAER